MTVRKMEALAFDPLAWLPIGGAGAGHGGHP